MNAECIIRGNIYISSRYDLEYLRHHQAAFKILVFTGYWLEKLPFTPI